MPLDQKVQLCNQEIHSSLNMKSVLLNYQLLTDGKLIVYENCSFKVNMAIKGHIELLAVQNHLHSFFNVSLGCAYQLRI